MPRRQRHLAPFTAALLVGILCASVRAAGVELQLSATEVYVGILDVVRQYRGSDGVLEWESPGTRGDLVVDIRVIDLDGDGVDEVLVAINEDGIDSYDALTHDRPYKRAWPHREAVDWIRDLSGTHLDPDVVTSFLRRLPQVEAIRLRLADEPARDSVLGEGLR